MVGIVIVSHSAKLAEGVVELARQMGGGEVALVAAAGVDDPEDPIGTDAFAIKEAIEEVWSDEGVLVLMDLGSAVMNAETALDFLEAPADSTRVLLCEAPLVEGAVAAVAAARIGASLSDVAAEARAGLFPKADHLGGGLADSLGQERETLGSDALTLRLTILNPLGLHLRPAGRLVQAVGALDAEVEVSNVTTGAGPVPARSLSRVSSLGVRQGHEIEVRAGGREARRALEEVERLVAASFGESDEPPPAPEPAIPPPTEPGMHTGVGVSPGLAVGPARRLIRRELEIPDRTSEDADIELGRLRTATEAARLDIESQREAAASRAGEAEAGIFDAHLLMLDDEALWSAAVDAIQQGSTAERAWDGAVREVVAGFRELEDPYQADRAADVEAVGRQVLCHLLGVSADPEMTEKGILVAEDLTPGETAKLDPARVEAIVTSAGGATSHSAIIARAMGVPAVVGTGPLAVEEGRLLLVDGGAGTVTIDPSEDEIAAARRRMEDEERRAAEARRTASRPAVTIDGRTVEVAANIGAVDDAREAADAGADGVGLLRTEFLFLDRQEAPDEEEQEATYRRIAETMQGRPVVLRTLDVGGDKPLPFLSQPQEANPFLGVRGLRLALAEPDLLITQLRAALKVAHDHPLRVMFPMVSTLTEWEAARTMVAKVADELGGLPAQMQLGVMVEVPALALVAERFAPVVDFFSIGTNDLTQYVLAAERGNASLAGLTDALHPAVLRLVDRTCRAARDHDRWVGVCGELAADPAAIPVLLGLGVTELSMSPVAIARAKQVVRRVVVAGAERLAAEALDMSTAEEVRRAALQHLAGLEMM